MMPRLITRFAHEAHGTASTEMALMVPLLVLLLFGGMEAGHYFWTEHRVIKAVRDGARYAGRQSFSAYTCANVDATVRGNISLLTRTGQLDATKDTNEYRKVKDWTDATAGDANLLKVTVACSAATTTGIYKNQVGGAPVITVAASVPYPSLFQVLGAIDGNARLKATARSAVMGI